ncbi:MAG: response regulator [Myxococcota bacterium]
MSAASSTAPLVTVLNVNDNVTSRYTTTRMLLQAGFQVIECPDGESALTHSLREPDVVVLDIRLPDIDGFEVCRRIKASPATAGVKVLLTSATFTTPESKIHGLEVGADGYLAQPFEATEMIATIHSLSKLKRAETELRRRAESLAEADLRKNEFLAMLAHELRNPLAAITASYPILERRAPMDEPERRARDVILRQTQHLTRMVDDLLDVARVTHGKIELRRELICLNELLQRVANTARETRMSGRNQNIAVTLPDVNIYTDGDVTRLEQVLNNLLDNASKYAEAGTIQMELLAPDSSGFARIRVRDRGVGIAPEQLSSIFNLFAQSGQTIARTKGGLGIGLTLVRTLVNLHGGTVVARSEGRGMGSEFEVSLPAVTGQALERGKSATKISDEGPSANTPPRRILLVEDNSDAQMALKDLLEIWGHDVITASDGLSGVERALAAMPEVALVDIGLPLIDGYEVARRIRAAKDGQSIHLVALTGYGSSEQRAKALEAGFDVHLVKPVEPLRLERLLMQLPARQSPSLRVVR